MQKKRKVSTSKNSSYNEEIIKTTKIFLGVVAVIALVYFITALVTGEIKFGNKNKKEEPAEIQYEEIIAGQILNRNEQNYYVLLLKFTDDKATQMLTLKDNYKNLNKKNIYILDLDKSFNSSIIKSEEEEMMANPTSIKNLKVDGTTLFEVKDKKVVKRVSGNDNVITFMQGLK